MTYKVTKYMKQLHVMCILEFKKGHYSLVQEIHV